MLQNTDFKICYLNARSLRKHTDDVQKDIIIYQARNCHGVHITILKTVKCPPLMVIRIYRCPKMVLSSLLLAIHATLLENHYSNVVIGDLNVNWFDEVALRSLYNLMVDQNALEQFISTCTT